MTDTQPITDAELAEIEAGAKLLLKAGIHEWERDSAQQTLRLVRTIREEREALGQILAAFDMAIRIGLGEPEMSSLTKQQVAAFRRAVRIVGDKP